MVDYNWYCNGNYFMAYFTSTSNLFIQATSRKMTIKLKILKQHKEVTLSLFNKSGKKQMFRDDKSYEIKVKPNETGEFTNLPSSVYTVKLNNQTLGKVGRKK